MADKKIINFTVRNRMAELPKDGDITIISKIDEHVEGEINSYEEYDTGLTMKVPKGATVLIHNNKNIIDMGYSFNTMVYDGNDEEKDVIIKLWKFKDNLLDLPVKIGKMSVVKSQEFFVSSTKKHEIDTSTNINTSRNTSRNFSLF